MITRLTKEGRGFKGAALYYLHDKKQAGETERLTTDRVAWTYAINLHTQDPQRAWKRMIATAANQAALKKAAGVKATGKKLKSPVMAFSLSWKPGQKPEAHEMLAAAQSSLAALGLQDHQVLVVCHNDTPHPHVHLLVNKVHPETGIAYTGSMSKTRLSAWAEAYEREEGEILCSARVENNARRAARHFDKTAELAARHKQKTRQQWQAEKYSRAYAAEVAAMLAAEFGHRAAVERAGRDRRAAERDAFWAERKATRMAIRDRYQAALDHSGDPAALDRMSQIADLLLTAEPSLSLQELTRDRSTFTRQDLARFVGRYTHSVEEFLAVMVRLESSPELVRLSHAGDGHDRFTTREVQALERSMDDHAGALQAGRHRAVTPLWPKGRQLSADQNTALKHVLAPPKLASIVGYAGSGKSTLLDAARRSWQASGFTVRGMGLSGIAADGLKLGAGIDSHTIHSRLLLWDNGKDLPTTKDVIVVDEAGMIGSRQMERVLHHARRGGAKVVLVGDPQQLQAIEAGGAFRSIVARYGAAELTTVRRQREAWQQEATQALATGRTVEAVARYEAAGMVHAHAEKDAAKAALIEGWSQARQEQPRASQIILAYTRADVRDLNDRARAVRREAGELGKDIRLATALGNRSFAANDRIYFLKNDGGLGVKNGSLGTIVEIRNRTLVVKLDGDDGRTIMFGVDKYDHIDHGYAATIHKSQGVTVDRAHLLAGRNLNSHATYVAMTRHRDRLDVHWDRETFRDRNQLARVLSREDAKDTSLDYVQDVDSAPAKRTISRLLASTAGEPVRDGRARMEMALAEQGARHSARIALRQARESKVGKFVPAPTQPAQAPEQRTIIGRTAEIAAFDAETIEMAEIMRERHWLEIAIEKEARVDLTRTAANDWQEALLSSVERQARQKVRRGLSMEADTDEAAKKARDVPTWHLKL